MRLQVVGIKNIDPWPAILKKRGSVIWIFTLFERVFLGIYFFLSVAGSSVMIIYRVFLRRHYDSRSITRWS